MAYEQNADPLPNAKKFFTKHFLADVAQFEKDIAAVINKHGWDNKCNTPDFILARLIRRNLVATEESTGLRESWYGRMSEYQTRGSFRTKDS